MAGVEGFRGNLGDGLVGAGHRHPHRMVLIQRGQQIHEHLPVWIILNHGNFLADNALLLVHALLGKPGHGHKGQENPQIVLKFFGAFKIIARNCSAGEGVGRGAVGRQVLKGVAVLGVEELVLQEMGHAGGGVLPDAVHLIAHVHAAVIGGKKGVALAEFRLGEHVNGQPVIQPGMCHGLANAGILPYFHRFTPPCRLRNRSRPAPRPRRRPRPPPA
ncbi:hypothetical protein SDC9_114634 [bioreactor metagenome]|uniref:Uncharacterized protein n=1 Tax=bioreactor metagenome TaxID=1076179 RepID=A0A645BQK8_9ZZZZ